MINDIGDQSRRHGSPYDRGSADAYYRRAYNPHYYMGATYETKVVEGVDMTEAERLAYAAGFDERQASGDFKEW